MLGALVLAVAVVAVHAEPLATNVIPCTHHTGPLPLHVHVEGCEGLPCEVNPGQEVVMHTVFKVPRTTRTMRSSVTAWVIGVAQEPDPGAAGETCNTLTNSYCPVVEGEILRSTTRVPLHRLLPTFPISIPVEFRIEDDNGLNFVCLRLSVRLVSSDTLAGNGTVEEPLELDTNV